MSRFFLLFLAVIPACDRETLPEPVEVEEGWTFESMEVESGWSYAELNGDLVRLDPYVDDPVVSVVFTSDGEVLDEFDEALSEGEFTLDSSEVLRQALVRPYMPPVCIEISASGTNYPEPTVIGCTEHSEPSLGDESPGGPR